MVVTAAVAPEDYSVYTAKSVTDFLEYLLPGASHWRGAKRGELGYRGQASSDWGLVPKAFRPDELKKYDPNLTTVSPTRVVPQSQAEYRAVHEFVRIADASGLQITEAGGRLLLYHDPRQVFNDPNWQYTWPKNEVVEILALAQHHGVPTRLLDFTEDPFVAAFFAARPAWDQRTGRAIARKGGRHLAVWVIDLRFVQCLNMIGGRYPERIQEVRVPRATNNFLRAQVGFFLLDRGANDVMSRGESLSIERAAADRANYWRVGNRLAEEGMQPTWFDDVPIRQVRLRSDRTGELLRELENRGVQASLMPSLDRVVESLEFQRSIP